MIEEALPFTVYRTMLTAVGRLLLQGRGLLQMKYQYWQKARHIEKLHIELMFVKIEHPDEYKILCEFEDVFHKYKNDSDYSKERIFFDQIESVFFRRGLIISKLVFKLRPEQSYTLLNVDPIKREIVLYVSRQDRELAKRFESAIAVEVSNEKLNKLLKDIENPDIRKASTSLG